MKKQKREEWIFDSKYNLQDKNFSKIFSFYVIECPVQNVSQRGITLQELGWNLQSLNACLKRSIKDTWSIINKNTDFFSIHNTNQSVTLPIEFAYHTKSKNSIVESLLYSIRCSLAHGGFSIINCRKEKYYLLENKHDGVIKGRIFLKESTLLLWIDIIKRKK